VTALIPILLKGRHLRPHKAVVAPVLGSRTVLSGSPWEFVSLWLKKEAKTDAQFYWDQARQFHAASVGLPTESAPLLHYYSFLNAAKALLASKSVAFHEHHGIKHRYLGGPKSRTSIVHEGVKILQGGVFPALSSYYGETEPNKIHSVRDLFFNLPYIHRTYCLTFPAQVELFVPVKDLEYVVDRSRQMAFFRATLSNDFANMRVVRRLPAEFAFESEDGRCIRIRSAAEVAFSRPKSPTLADLARIASLQRALRPNLFYINGAQTLWYIRSIVAGPPRIARFPPTITLAAMHRLSELSRYQPLKLRKLLSSQENWLISEFIQQAPGQFLDEIASELTGHQFLVPNLRAPT
jgi:hypothetical protein